MPNKRYMNYGLYIPLIHLLTELTAMHRADQQVSPFGFISLWGPNCGSGGSHRQTENTEGEELKYLERWRSLSIIVWIWDDLKGSCLLLVHFWPTLLFCASLWSQDSSSLKLIISKLQANVCLKYCFYFMWIFRWRYRMTGCISQWVTVKWKGLFGFPGSGDRTLTFL